LAFAIYLNFYFFGHGNSSSKDIDVLLPVFFREFILAAALVETTIAEYILKFQFARAFAPMMI
jgi:hypothetical protein